MQIKKYISDKNNQSKINFMSKLQKNACYELKYIFF